MNKTFFKFIFTGILSFLSINIFAQPIIYELDASKVDKQAKTINLKVEPHPDAEIQFAANSRYFMRKGKPWFPLIGEFHYNRYPHQYWEEEIIKMKSAGLSIVATYIFWNAHEVPKGVWDWENDLNLRRFIELCKKHDMYVWLRIGPWAHGEQLYGGHPKWINRMLKKRTDSPKYLKEVTKLFQQIGEQTAGLYYNNGGAIIGVQLENEYTSGQKEHIETLRKIALKSNITPVYFSVTGNSVFNDKAYDTFPLQGGYPYRGWEKAGGTATPDFLYGDDQWIMAEDFGKLYYELDKYPKGTCEQGCGSQMTYKNRFVVEPHVIEAHLQNQIGRGMNLIGYYMFHGGTQITGLKEPGYPESYDFQSPISEFGFLRPSYKYLKILHHFINDFGEDLAKTTVFYPENPVKDEKNTDCLRYVARISDNSGYVFLGNTQVRIDMPDKQFKLRINLPCETIEFPRNEFLLKGQTTAILPINLYLNKALLKYATVQALSRIENNNEEFLFFMQLKDVQTELAFDATTVKNISAESWNKEEKQGIIYLTPKNENPKLVKITDKQGLKSTIVLLSREQAENTWRTQLNEKEYLIISKADLMFYDDKIDLRQFGNNQFSFDVYPAIKQGLLYKNAVLKASQNGIFQHFDLSKKKQDTDLVINKIEKNEYTIQLPDSLSNYLSDLFLDISYLGGSATAKINGEIVTDNLYNGTNWLFGLKRYINKNTQIEIDFEAFSWQNNITGVPKELVKKIKENGAEILEIKVRPQYNVTIITGSF
ncbi:MAG: hypothetical protein DRJ07_05215 [Bacteroidetes bacterium]|nr:MAG: hypothetical protein DRJ07_05215 [Bacteroidota bacterium]